MTSSDSRTRISLLARPSQEDETTELLHYAHPRTLHMTWCGTQREPKPYDWGPKPHMERCAMCAYLLGTYGSRGWHEGLS